MDSYQLLLTQIAHDGPIRSLSLGTLPGEILTGCQSDLPCVRRWKLSSNCDAFVEVGSPLYHDHWVPALITLRADPTREAYPEGLIITGCLDSKIRVFDSSGNLLKYLLGHSKGVISFSWTTNNLLVSGGWDGLAIVWDVFSGTELIRLGPHENGVNVLGLPNGLIATTSTGESVNGKPDNFKLRLWDPSTGQLVSDPIVDHGGPIRSINYLPGVDGLITTSNDGSVMLRGSDGQALEALLHPLQDDNSHPMVLQATTVSASHLNIVEVVSCGEDGSVCVWRNGDLLQTIYHPSTVWAVLGLTLDQGEAFLTGGQDGILRLFMRNSALTHSPRAQQLAVDFTEEVARAKQARQHGPSEEDLAKAPRWENRGSLVGKSENEVMVFNQDGKLVAAQWTSGSWTIVGEVTGSADGGDITGVHYDHVFPVEMDTPNGPRTMKLGYNNGENPFVAAQRFIDTNELGQYHLNEIADWIIQRTQQAAVPTIGSSVQSTPKSGARKSVTFHQEIKGYVAFDEVPSNIQKVIQKIRDVHSQHTIHLNEEQLTILEQTLQTLSETNRYHASSLPSSLLGILAVMMKWRLENRFIPLDFLRMMALHTQGSEMLATSVFCRTFLQSTIDLLRDPSAPQAAVLMACRFTANTIKSEALKQVLCTNVLNEARELIYASLAFAGYGSKNVRQAVVSVAYNVVAALKLSSGTARVIVTVDLLQTIAKRSLELIEVENEGNVAVLRAAQLLGTLFLSEGSQFAALAPVARACLTAAASKWATHSDVTNCIQEVLNLV
eukprot:gene3555-3892_t